jgi:hypothetical protein
MTRMITQSKRTGLTIYQFVFAEGEPEPWPAVR